MTKERIPILLLFTASLFLPDLSFYRFSTAEDKMTATKAPSAKELRLLEQYRKFIYNGRFRQLGTFPSGTHVNGHTI
jgi:hypothetical protein